MTDSTAAVLPLIALVDAVRANLPLAKVTSVTVYDSKLKVRFISKDPHALSAIRHMAIRAGAKKFTGTFGVDIIPGRLTAHF